MTTHLQIIALTGLAGTGKDTAADILVTHCGFTKLAFADALRNEVVNAYAAADAPALRAMLSRRDTKETATTRLALAECQDLGFLGACARCAIAQGMVIGAQWLREPRSPRQIMQWWGTEYRRAQSINYWTNQLAAHINQLHQLDGRTRFVITDCRFENEAAMIRAMGGVVWQIVRDGVQPVEGQHASATDGTKLAPSVVIDNSDTLHSLREAVLAEWLALETQTDVLRLQLENPAHGDPVRAQTFGALA
jgi:hypothetical protein